MVLHFAFPNWGASVTEKQRASAHDDISLKVGLSLARDVPGRGNV